MSGKLIAQVAPTGAGYGPLSPAAAQSPAAAPENKSFDMTIPHSQLLTQVIGYMLLLILIIIFITEILIIRDTTNFTSAFKRLRNAGDTGRTLVAFEYILWAAVGPLVLFITTQLHQRVFIGWGNMAYVIAAVATLLVGIFYKFTGIDRLFLSPSDPNVRKSFWYTFFSNEMEPSVEKVIMLLKTASFVIMAVFIGLGVLFTFASLNSNLLYYLFPTTVGTGTQFAKFVIDIFLLPFILMIPVLLRILYVNQIMGRKVMWRRAIMIWFLFFVAPTIIFMMFFSLLHVLDDYTYDVNIGALTQQVKAASEKQQIRRAIIDALTKKLVVKNGEPFDNYATAHKAVADAIKGLPPNFVAALNSYLFTPSEGALIQLNTNNQNADKTPNPTGQMIIDACIRIKPVILSASAPAAQAASASAGPAQPRRPLPQQPQRPPPQPPRTPQPDQSLYEQHFDQVVKKPYYYNKETGLSSYDKPDDLRTAKLPKRPPPTLPTAAPY